MKERKETEHYLPSASVVLESSLVLSSTALLVLKHAKRLEFKLMKKATLTIFLRWIHMSKKRKQTPPDKLIKRFKHKSREDW